MVESEVPGRLIPDEREVAGTVSVALAVCNGERFIREQIESILGQTHPVDEIVVSDDCSDDDTLKIAEDCLAEFERKVVVRNSRRAGVVGNFERAMKLCTGTYIALCDQDDVWEPNKIERLLAEIGDASLVYSDFSVIDENGLPHPNPDWAVRRDFRGIDSSTPALTRTTLHCDFILGCVCMIRASLLDHALPIPDIGLHTHDWWLGCVAAGTGGVRYVDEPLIRYRRHGGNASGNVLRPRTLARFLAYFSSERRRARYVDAMTLLKGAEAMENQAFSYTAADRRDIARAKAYSQAMLKNRRPLFRARYAWSNSDVLVPGNSGLINRTLLLASRMIPIKTPADNETPRA